MPVDILNRGCFAKGRNLRAGRQARRVLVSCSLACALGNAGGMGIVILLHSAGRAAPLEVIADIDGGGSA